ncbi:MAG: hypothetical protein QNJ45_03025 [Ardenticatenaceae bacterium]|nr:hypothetical protein [Ardenticatenaceae bacterium]
MPERLTYSPLGHYIFGRRFTLFHPLFIVVFTPTPSDSSHGQDETV